LTADLVHTRKKRMETKVVDQDKDKIRHDVVFCVAELPISKTDLDSLVEIMVSTCVKDYDSEQSKKCVEAIGRTGYNQIMKMMRGVNHLKSKVDLDKKLHELDESGDFAIVSNASYGRSVGFKTATRSIAKDTIDDVQAVIPDSRAKKEAATVIDFFMKNIQSHASTQTGLDWLWSTIQDVERRSIFRKEILYLDDTKMAQVLLVRIFLTKEMLLHKSWGIDFSKNKLDIEIEVIRLSPLIAYEGEESPFKKLDNLKI